MPHSFSIYKIKQNKNLSLSTMLQYQIICISKNLKKKKNVSCTQITLLTSMHNQCSLNVRQFYFDHFVAKQTYQYSLEQCIQASPNQVSYLPNNNFLLDSLLSNLQFELNYYRQVKSKAFRGKNPLISRYRNYIESDRTQENQ